MMMTPDSSPRPGISPLLASGPRRTRAYVVTLGLSRPGPGDIIEAIANDIRNEHPDYLGMLCTEETVSGAERLVAELGNDAPPHEVRILAAATDLNQAFEEMNDFIRTIMRDRGFTPQEIAINYTSGTKVMASGALLSGVFHQVEALRYLMQGAGEGGSSQALVTDPRGVFMHRDMELAKRLALELRFMSANEVLKSLTEVVGRREGNETRLASLMRLRRLFEGFGAWDSFQYEAAIVAFRRAKEIPTDEPTRFDVDDSTLELLGTITEALDSSRFDVLLLADLYNNAQRRLREEKANDTATRAYRCLEMLAQYKLRTFHNIDTTNVDVRAIPPLSRDSFAAQRSYEDGRIRIGLRRSYELLALLRDPLGQLYGETRELREILQARYKSILGHGFRPLTLAEARGFIEQVRRVIVAEFPEFESTAAQLQFPWI
jgi:CRISPR-associated protein (TIGR02710 family)